MIQRRLVITVCPREPGIVTLPIIHGDRATRLNAVSILSHLRELAAARGLGERVRVREGCAGGCTSPGPNVSVEIFPMPRAGERPDHVAIGWKTYVYSLAALDCLAAVIEEHLPRGARAASARHRRRAP